MRLHAKPRELLAMQLPRRIVANLPHIARSQSPLRASRHRRCHLPPRQNVRRPKRNLRPPGRILRHRNNRIRSIQSHSDQIHPTQLRHSTSPANIVVPPFVVTSLRHYFVTSALLTETSWSSKSPPRNPPTTPNSPNSKRPPAPNGKPSAALAPSIRKTQTRRSPPQ